MTYEDARRRLERTTDFEFRGEQVLVRDVGTLRTIATMRGEALSAGAAGRPVAARWPGHFVSARERAA